MYKVKRKRFRFHVSIFFIFDKCWNNTLLYLSINGCSRSTFVLLSNSMFVKLKRWRWHILVSLDFVNKPIIFFTFIPIVITKLLVNELLLINQNSNFYMFYCTWLALGRHSRMLSISLALPSGSLGSRTLSASSSIW